MKQGETHGTSRGDGSPSVDAEEVRRRVVRAFAQIVGDAMSADCRGRSLESTQAPASDEAQVPQEDPARGVPDFFRLSPPERYLRGTADGIPAVGAGTSSPGLEPALATSPYGPRRRMIQPSGSDGPPYGMSRPQVSPRVRKMIIELYGGGSDPLDAGRKLLPNPSLFGDAEVTTIGVQPTDVELMQLGTLSARRRRLSLPFSGSSYGSPRSLWDIIPPQDLGRLPIFPRSTMLNNSQEVANDDDDGTSAEQG